MGMEVASEVPKSHNTTNNTTNNIATDMELSNATTRARAKDAIASSRRYLRRVGWSLAALNSETVHHANRSRNCTKLCKAKNKSGLH